MRPISPLFLLVPMAVATSADTKQKATSTCVAIGCKGLDTVDVRRLSGAAFVCSGCSLSDECPVLPPLLQNYETFASGILETSEANTNLLELMLSLPKKPLFGRKKTEEEAEEVEDEEEEEEELKTPKARKRPMSDNQLNDLMALRAQRQGTGGAYDDWDSAWLQTEPLRFDDDDGSYLQDATFFEDLRVKGAERVDFASFDFGSWSADTCDSRLNPTTRKNELHLQYVLVVKPKNVPAENRKRLQALLSKQAWKVTVADRFVTKVANVSFDKALVVRGGLVVEAKADAVNEVKRKMSMNVGRRGPHFSPNATYTFCMEIRCLTENVQKQAKTERQAEERRKRFAKFQELKSKADATKERATEELREERQRERDELEGLMMDIEDLTAQVKVDAKREKLSKSVAVSTDQKTQADEGEDRVERIRKQLVRNKLQKKAPLRVSSSEALVDALEKEPLSSAVAEAPTSVKKTVAIPRGLPPKPQAKEKLHKVPPLRDTPGSLREAEDAKTTEIAKSVMSELSMRDVEVSRGWARLGASSKGLASVTLLQERPEEPLIDPNPILDLATVQLREYFANKRRVFDIPLDLRGSDFQKRVWAVLLRIPYGETWTYGDVAAALGNPQASRAVGQAVKRNLAGIVVPCHRVVAKGGLGGFNAGLTWKKALLTLEDNSQNSLVDPVHSPLFDGTDEIKLDESLFADQTEDHHQHLTDPGAQTFLSSDVMDPFGEEYNHMPFQGFYDDHFSRQPEQHQYLKPIVHHPPSEEEEEEGDALTYERPNVTLTQCEELNNLDNLYDYPKARPLIELLLKEYPHTSGCPLGEGGREMLRACLMLKGCKGKLMAGANRAALMLFAQEKGLQMLAIRLRVERQMGAGVSPLHRKFIKFKSMQTKIRKLTKKQQMKAVMDQNGRLDVTFDDMKHLTIGKHGRDRIRRLIRKQHSNNPQNLQGALSRHGFDYQDLRNATVSQLLKMAHVCGLWHVVVEEVNSARDRKGDPRRLLLDGPLPHMRGADLSAHVRPLVPQIVPIVLPVAVPINVAGVKSEPIRDDFITVKSEPQ